MYQIVIPGKPISKARPRFFRKGKFVGTYNTQITEEGRWILEAKEQLKELKEPLGGPVCLYATFLFPCPKSIPKKLRLELEAGNDHQVPHCKKLDIDNLLKFVKDCLNGVAWLDDKQIVEVHAAKNYTLDARGMTILVIE